MSSHAATTQVKANWGGGGVSPLGASYGKLYMWFFLVSDAFTFSGLLTAYGFMRHKYTDFWPNPGHVFHHLTQNLLLYFFYVCLKKLL
jgi:cytochrome c oxidase subunit 3